MGELLSLLLTSPPPESSTQITLWFWWDACSLRHGICSGCWVVDQPPFLHPLEARLFARVSRTTQRDLSYYVVLPLKLACGALSKHL